MKKRRAFSLIELLIASAIFTVVAASIYTAFRTGMFGYKKIQENIEVEQAARFIFARINLDLRNAFSYSSAKSGFTGFKEGMSFYSLSGTFSGGRMRQDYALVSYVLKDGKLMRTCRKNVQAIGEGADIAAQELPGYADSLALTYGYAGEDKKTIIWKDDWLAKSDSGQGEEKQLPAAVKINLKLKNNPEGYPRKSNNQAEEFQRTIFLPLGG